MTCKFDKPTEVLAQAVVRRTKNPFLLPTLVAVAGFLVAVRHLPAPVVVNGQYTVTNPISGKQQFFRLSQ